MLRTLRVVRHCERKRLRGEGRGGQEGEVRKDREGEENGDKSRGEGGEKMHREGDGGRSQPQSRHAQTEGPLHHTCHPVVRRVQYVLMGCEESGERRRLAHARAAGAPLSSSHTHVCTFRRTARWREAARRGSRRTRSRWRQSRQPEQQPGTDPWGSCIPCLHPSSGAWSRR